MIIIFGHWIIIKIENNIQYQVISSSD